ncbi:hypothetical protein [Sabulicella glaciei]|uniref:Uncharacterized protein n=1 Tax=Sabulicella glaciei TaxID=2984948 RepID=A0ABT3P3A3_9PROT|nr:hypothetical protein [Roseococcus sp. MDT2-1-1]MCW8088254.1 hypothetical protein [Roseococcus sp. MDT2-1-1]
MAPFDADLRHTTTHSARPSLPRFVREIGLRPDDVERFGSNASADARTLMFTERGPDSLPTGVLTLGERRKCWFTKGGMRSLTWSREPQNPSRILLATGALPALCAAACEGHRADTLYVAPPGSWSGFSVWTFEALLARVRPECVVIGMPDTARANRLAEEAQQIIEVGWCGAMAVLRLPMTRDWPECLAAQREARP